jgi:hypothetical protein
VGALVVLYIGQDNEVRGRGTKSGGRQWVFNTGRFETEKEREGRHLMRGTEEAQAVLPMAARVLSVQGDDPGWAGLGQIGRAEQAGCENFQGNDLGYQGESGRIENGLWQILFTIFKQRFGF